MHEHYNDTGLNIVSAVSAVCMHWPSSLQAADSVPSEQAAFACKSSQGKTAFCLQPSFTLTSSCPVLQESDT